MINFNEEERLRFSDIDFKFTWSFWIITMWLYISFQASVIYLFYKLRKAPLVNKYLIVIISLNINLLVRTIMVSYFFLIYSDQGNKICPYDRKRHHIVNNQLAKYLLWQEAIFQS